MVATESSFFCSSSSTGYKDPNVSTGINKVAGGLHMKITGKNPKLYIGDEEIKGLSSFKMPEIETDKELIKDFEKSLLKADTTFSFTSTFKNDHVHFEEIPLPVSSRIFKVFEFDEHFLDLNCNKEWVSERFKEAINQYLFQYFKMNSRESPNQRG